MLHCGHYHIWVFITNKGAQFENSETSTDMRTAVINTAPLEQYYSSICYVSNETQKNAEISIFLIMSWQAFQSSVFHIVNSP